MSKQSEVKKQFRILSLSGGGARGIFQAKYLERLEDKLGGNLAGHFELIAGTSVGAINALAITLGIDLGRLNDFYNHHAKSIFKPKFLASFRKGPRYLQENMRKPLKELFGNRQIGEAEPYVLVTATSIELFRHRVFSTMPSDQTDDNGLSAVDVAIASAATPTYFSPVQPVNEQRNYIDGGLWANSPCLVGITYAHKFLNIPYSNMRVLTVGSGSFPEGIIKSQLENIRPISIDAIRILLDSIFTSQITFAEESVEQLVGADNMLNVNCQLPKVISLDDAKSALSILPQLAEQQADITFQHVQKLLKKSERFEEILESNNVNVLPPIEPRVFAAAAGLSAFFPSRDYYNIWREKNTISEYISIANKSLVMISVHLVTGMHIDGILEVIGSRLNDPNLDFSATISLLDPNRSDLMSAMSVIFDQNEELLAQSIKDRLNELAQFKRSLSMSAKKRFKLRAHKAIPFGSAILIDHKEPQGRIQIETKPYKTPLRKSIAFEIIPTGSSGLYKTLIDSYEKLIDDGSEVTSA